MSYLYIYIFHVTCQDFVNVENHAYWQKLFKYELLLQETPGTISRSALLNLPDIESVEKFMFVFSISNFDAVMNAISIHIHLCTPSTPSNTKVRCVSTVLVWKISFQFVIICCWTMDRELKIAKDFYYYTAFSRQGCIGIFCQLWCHSLSFTYLLMLRFDQYWYFSQYR